MKRQIIKTITLILLSVLCFESYGQNESWESLVQKGRKAYEQGNYSLAIKIIEKAKIWAEKEFGKNHPKYAESINNLALLYYSQGEYKKAEPLFLEALKIDEEVLGKNHPGYATSLGNLAFVYDRQGLYPKAKPLYLEALKIREKVLGKNHPDYAFSLNGLAGFYYVQGLYTKAEPLYLEALKIREKVLGKNHPDYTTSLNNLAELYRAQGLYKKAEPLYLEVLKIDEKVLGKNHPDYATSLNNLANVYESQGLYTKAEPLYVETLKIIKKSLGKNHPNYASSLGNLAALYDSQGLYPKSEPLYVEAKNIFEKVLGKQHPDYARSLNNLALLYSYQGLYTKSEPLFVEAFKIIEKVLGKNHPDYAGSLNYLAGLYRDQGLYTKAEPLYLESNTTTLNFFNQNSTLLSEKERKTFFESNEGFFDDFKAFLVDYYQETKTNQALQNVPKLLKALQNLTLATKAQLLDSKKGLLNLVAEKIKTNARLRKVYEEYVGLKAFTSKVINLPLADQKKQGVDIAGNIKKINDLEKELYKSIGEEGQTQAQLGSGSPFTFKNLQQSLKPGEGTIEMVRHLHWDKKSKKSKLMYLVLITTNKTKEAPKLIILENGEALEKRYAAYYKNSVIFKRTDRYSYKQFFEPIAKYLGENNIRKVYLSPDGVYNSINLNTLKNPQTGKFVEESYDIRMVSTLRDLLKGKQKRSNSGKAIALGRPDYNASTEELEGLEKALKERSKMTTGAGYLTSQALLAKVSKPIEKGKKRAGNTRPGWTDLPGTEAEVKAINELLQKYGKSKGIKAQLGLGKAVNELAIKSIRRPKILHIATHGFFIPDERNDQVSKAGEEKKITFRSGSAKNSPKNAQAYKVLSLNPMLRSGIALAGINSYDKANPKPTNIEDGILTAYEASQMDLRGTELVVLSACETGLGDVQNGEGIYGLQRAFIVAGAENVILSLWKVDDEATMLLMSKFYEEWIKNGKSKRAAFRAAQKYLRGFKKAYEHPYYWGAFQFVGVE